MAEFTNTMLQTVAAGQNVVFTETPVYGGECILHREGAGVVTLKGMTNQCRALYKVSFGGNIQIPAGGTVGEISIALTVEGEPLASATAIVTPAAVEEFANVYVSVLVEAPRGCCVSVAVENTSDEAIEVQNANLIVERVA
ncbi:MAG: hypothetical protein J6S23_01645 [Clostridia bacterium]|nr:hypothetical protein [Clostridia bacterium]